MSLSNPATRLVAIGLLGFLGMGCAPADPSSSKTGSKGGAAGTSGGSGGSAGSGTSTGGKGVGGSDIGGITPPADAGTNGGFGCQNLQCYQNTCKMGSCKVSACPNGGTTSISGSIYDPAGITPLYNIIVYVPNAPVDQIPTGATCEQCGKVSGQPITSTLTNSKGEFKLDNVPVTANIPLVIQVGKWRREIVVPNVTSCADTRLSDRNQTRLPKSSAEGHLPRIALTTGGADGLECLLRKIGIADSEFTPETGAGRVNFYVGEGGTPKYSPAMNAGAGFGPAPTFWSNAGALKAYDMVLLSCEGIEMSMNKSVAARQAMLDYTSAGGRVFASHWHNFWIEFGPQPFPTVAQFSHQPDLPNPFTASIDMTFPKGQALAEWLVAVGSKAPLGQVVITEGKHTVGHAVAPQAQQWVYSTLPVSTQYFSFNTPVNEVEEKQCGRMVMSDIHVSALDMSTPQTAYPDGCKTTTLSDQEKVLEFMLFDLSACVTKDTKPPEPPK